MKINLQELAQGFLAAHTDEELAKASGLPPSLVVKWRGGQAVPLKVLQSFIDRWPEPEVDAGLTASFAAALAAPTVSVAWEKPVHIGRLAYCIPMSRRMGPRELGSFSRLFDATKMKLMTEETYDNFVNRNRLAARFLASECEYSYWSDDDMIPQCADAPWFYLANKPWANHYSEAMAGLHTIGRLLFHKKKFIGGAYFARDGSGKPMWSSAAEDPNLARAAINAGPHEEVQGPLKWIGFGAVLIHRSVFEDIRDKGLANVDGLERKPHLQYQYGFFDKIDDQSDDVSFCQRARQAGHEIFCDLSVMPAHMGNRPYTNR